jgi:hypothetical protein
MRRGLVVALSLLALALAAMVSPAVAKPTARAQSATAEQARASEHRRIVEYWTPQRRASAKPRDIVVPLGSKAQTRAKPGTGSGGDVLGASWTAGGSVSVTTGKVFFTSGGSRYVCSGSAVSSSSRSLVLTAGHCAHDGGPGASYVTNWIFYPRYRSGADPVLGAWTASKLVATQDWTTRANAFENDAAFAKVGNGTATTLEAALAAQGGTTPGISFTRPATGSKVHSFGYPAAGKYNGTILIYCSGGVTIGYDGVDTQSIPCDMTGGSSGGPWFQGFSSGNAPGTLNSVNSYGYSSLKNRMFGPIFDTAQEQAAYNAANA